MANFKCKYCSNLAEFVENLLQLGHLGFRLHTSFLLVLVFIPYIYFRISWNLPDLGDCEPDSLQLVRKIFPTEGPQGARYSIKHRAKDIPYEFGSGTVVTLESGPEVLLHKIGYSLTLHGSHLPSKSVTVSSPLVRFRPIKCSSFNKWNVADEFSVEQV